MWTLNEIYYLDASRIFQWLAFSTRPLRIEELAEVVVVNMKEDPRFKVENRYKDPRGVLKICSSLVTLSTETKTRTVVELAHFSVKEYLVSERIQNGEAKKYIIEQIPAHISITEVSLGYLLQFDKLDSLDSETTEKFPLAEYAAQHWTQHARAAGKDSMAINPLIKEFFLFKKNAYVNWIRLFDLDYESARNNRIASPDKTASPLYYASLAGLAESVKLLLDEGVDVNAQGGRYGNALYAAVRCSHDEIIQHLINAEADVNAEGRWTIFLVTEGQITEESNYVSVLHTASEMGHSQIVQRLLQAGAKVNMRGRHNRSKPLYEASKNGHDQVVQLLLNAGADVNAQGGNFGNALQAASSEGHDQIVQRLLEARANVHTQGGEYGNALQAASKNGHDQVVQQLLDAGSNVNAQGGAYGSALYAASKNGHDQIVQRLLEAGADVNAQGWVAQPVYKASDEGRDQIIHWLFNAKSVGNAIQAASREGHGQIVQRLLNIGADINALVDIIAAKKRLELLSNITILN
jgi:ankyrin repeat protein